MPVEPVQLRRYTKNIQINITSAPVDNFDLSESDAPTIGRRDERNGCVVTNGDTTDDDPEQSLHHRLMTLNVTESHSNPSLQINNSQSTTSVNSLLSDRSRVAVPMHKLLKQRWKHRRKPKHKLVVTNHWREIIRSQNPSDAIRNGIIHRVGAAAGRRLSSGTPSNTTQFGIDDVLNSAIALINAQFNVNLASIATIPSVKCKKVTADEKSENTSQNSRKKRSDKPVVVCVNEHCYCTFYYDTTSGILYSYDMCDGCIHFLLENKILVRLFFGIRFRRKVMLVTSQDRQREKDLQSRRFNSMFSAVANTLCIVKKGKLAPTELNYDIKRLEKWIVHCLDSEWFAVVPLASNTILSSQSSSDLTNVHFKTIKQNYL